MSRFDFHAVGATLLLATGLVGCSLPTIPAPVPQPVQLSARWTVTPFATEWRIQHSDGSEMELVDAIILADELKAKGCRRHDIEFAAGRLDRSYLGYFDCDGLGIEVEKLLGTKDSLVMRLASPPAVAPASDPIWHEGEVVPFPEALSRAGHCVGFTRLQLLEDGTVDGEERVQVGEEWTRSGRINAGSWRMNDGDLEITSVWVEPGQEAPDAPAEPTFMCVDAQLWSDGRKLGWACRDQFVNCSLAGALPTWVSVTGTPEHRDAVGRVLANVALYRAFFAVLPGGGSQGTGLRVLFRRGGAREARSIAGVIERDLGVVPMVLQNSDIPAPIVIDVGDDVVWPSASAVP